MTRRCVLCKETNYKNTFSFFSAPKDPETRKLWTKAIAIDDYVVSDDTFVCSKHFSPDDIITHWISGVPPHVVTIKYKKCRLRPGALPSTSCEFMNTLLNSPEDDYEEFVVNRGVGRTVARRPVFSPNSDNETFLIPREDDAQSQEPTNPDDPYVDAKETTVVYEDGNMYSIGEIADEDSSEVTNNSQQIENPTESASIKIENANKFNCQENVVDAEPMYADSVDCEQIDCEQIDCIEEIEIVSDSKPNAIDYEPMKNHIFKAEDTSTDMWDSIGNDNNCKVLRNLKNTSTVYSSEDERAATPDPLDIRINEDNTKNTDEKPMLFEDLLDIYTEVQLPRGWSSMVTSKGHSTTVVYVFMSMTRNGLPYVEKQVFLKSDMKIRCGAANKEINPQLHSLVRDGRNRIVYTLSDVEELVEEFDLRIVCEGCAGEKTRPEDIENSTAYRDVSAKWRHVDCPIIINNGSSRCSKCSTLDGSYTRSRTRRHNNEAHKFATAITKKERTIRVLQRLLRKMNKRNQRFETTITSVDKKINCSTNETEKTFVEILETRNIPKIQKIMVKECLKASESDRKRIKYSDTWVFLCLLLYMESPRMYRYMLLNKYMVLPSMRIIRRYLHQIKTDTKFYNFFQKSIEPFQPSERDGEKKPT